MDATGHKTVEFITKQAQAMAGGRGVASQLHEQAYSGGDPSDVFAPAVVPMFAKLWEKGTKNKATRRAYQIMTGAPGSGAYEKASGEWAEEMAENPGRFKDYLKEKGADKHDFAYYKRKAMNDPKYRRALAPYLSQGSAMRSKVLSQRRGEGKGQGAIVGGARIPPSEIKKRLAGLRGARRRRRNLFQTAQNQNEKDPLPSGVRAFLQFLKGDRDLGDVVKSFVT